jgi:hypothetical protein
MSGLEHLQRFHVPTTVVTETMEFLAAMGKTGCEGLALWVGSIDGSDGFVTQVVAPQQTPIRSEDGLAVYVGPEALHDLNVWLHQHQRRLLAQVHSHGEHAYHSPTDDQYSIVTTVGAVSIVIPGFARDPFDLRTCSVHRLTSDGWVTLRQNEAAGMLVLER